MVDDVEGVLPSKKGHRADTRCDWLVQARGLAGCAGDNHNKGGDKLVIEMLYLELRWNIALAEHPRSAHARVTHTQTSDLHRISGSCQCGVGRSAASVSRHGCAGEAICRVSHDNVLVGTDVCIVVSGSGKPRRAVVPKLITRIIGYGLVVALHVGLHAICLDSPCLTSGLGWPSG